MLQRTFTRVATLALVLSGTIGPLLAQAPAAAPREEGETWEQTIQMTAMGTNLPQQKHKFCRPKNAEPSGPPMPDDANCTLSDLKIVGPRVSWKVACKEPQSMSGAGEIVYSGREAYSGTMTMTSPQGDMVMQLAGRRLGDACDAGAMKREVVAMQDRTAAMQRQALDAQAASCVAMADSLTVFAFAGANPPCSDSAHKAMFCAKLRTEEGFAILDAPDGAQIKQAAELCGADPEALRSQLCGGALKHESLDFLGKSCPDLAKPIAQRECAGRSYTSLTGTKYQNFCVRFAGPLLADGSDAEAVPGDPAPADAKDGAVKKAKKKLSGLFGR